MSTYLSFLFFFLSLFFHCFYLLSFIFYLSFLFFYSYLSFFVLFFILYSYLLVSVSVFLFFYVWLILNFNTKDCVKRLRFSKHWTCKYLSNKKYIFVRKMIIICLSVFTLSFFYSFHHGVVLGFFIFLVMFLVFCLFIYEFVTLFLIFYVYFVLPFCLFVRDLICLFLLLSFCLVHWFLLLFVLSFDFCFC